MRVNLAQSSGKVFTVNWSQIVFIILFIIMIFGLSVNYYLASLEINNLDNKIEEIDRQLAIYNPQKQEYFETQKKINDIRQKLKEKEAKSLNFSINLKEMGFVVPGNVTFQTLTYNGNLINISGMASNPSGVTGLMNNLKQSPFFSDVTLISIEQREDVQFRMEVYLAGRD